MSNDSTWWSVAAITPTLSAAVSAVGTCSLPTIARAPGCCGWSSARGGLGSHRVLARFGLGSVQGGYHCEPR